MRVWMAMVKSSGPSGSPCWSCRRDGGASKAEMGWVVVTPCHPAANAGEVGCSGCRYCSARDAIEDIGEVEFDQHFARGRLAPSSPSPGSVDSNPDTSFHPDSGSGVLLYHLHQAFCNESAQDFTNGNGPHSLALALRPSQPRPKQEQRQRRHDLEPTSG